MLLCKHWPIYAVKAMFTARVRHMALPRCQVRYIKVDKVADEAKKKRFVSAGIRNY